MPWPNSARATGYVVTAADWNEISAALALWGANSDADGNSLIDVATIVCGNGDATGTTAAGTSRGAARTGTNVAGSNVTIAAGNGTGTGGGGALIFQTAPAGSSGTTANTLTDRMWITPTGEVGFGTQTPSSAVQITTNTNNGLVITDGTTTGLVFVSSGNAFSIGAVTASGSIAFYSGNALNMSLASNGGLVVGAATGGSQGAGTINAVGVYDDGVLLTCYVPELKNKDGDTSQIDLAAWDARVPDRVIPAKIDRKTGEVIEPERIEVRRHEPLRDFLTNRADTIDPRAYAARWKATGVLPGFPTPQEWADNGPLSTGQLLQKLWEHIELQAVHIDQLATEIDALRN